MAIDDKITSREVIMNKLKTAHHSNVQRPVIPNYAVIGDRIENFKKKLEGFDGKCLEFRERSDAVRWLTDNIDMNSNVYSNIPEIHTDISAESIADPHDANTIDVCIAEGNLGVGETGSIWVTNKSLGLAAAALFSTDLYLLLEKDKVVSGIQDAYERIELVCTQYGSLFSGPSATADIEAVHITGAQGEISLTALLY